MHSPLIIGFSHPRLRVRFWLSSYGIWTCGLMPPKRAAHPALIRIESVSFRTSGAPPPFRCKVSSLTTYIDALPPFRREVSCLTTYIDALPPFRREVSSLTTYIDAPPPFRCKVSSLTTYIDAPPPLPRKVSNLITYIDARPPFRRKVSSLTTYIDARPPPLRNVGEMKPAEDARMRPSSIPLPSNQTKDPHPPRNRGRGSPFVRPARPAVPPEQRGQPPWRF